jgi:hypothetical protein
MKTKPAKATADNSQIPAAASPAVRKMGAITHAVEFLASFMRYLLSQV